MRNLGANRCTARSKRSGKRCRKWTRRGAAVCPMHGGKAPQVERKAEDRMLALQDPAVAAVARAVNGKDIDVALRGSKVVFDRTNFGRVGLLSTEQVEGMLRGVAALFLSLVADLEVRRQFALGLKRLAGVDIDVPAPALPAGREGLRGAVLIGDVNVLRQVVRYRDDGIKVVVDGGEVVVRSDRPIPPAVSAWVVAHRDPLRRLLAGDRPEKEETEAAAGVSCPPSAALAPEAAPATEAHPRAGSPAPASSEAPGPNRPAQAARAPARSAREERERARATAEMFFGLERRPKLFDKF